MSQAQQAPLTARDVLYEAARVACLAPSIEDSQPWLWRIRADTLELRMDRSRQLTGTDPQGRLMVISCGAVLHHACVVLAVLGVAFTVDRLDDPAEPDLLARLTLTGPHVVTADDMRLHHALRTRCTDRRPFLGVASLPEDVMALLRRAAQPFAVGMYELEPPVPTSAAAVMAFTWPTHQIPESRDGVPPTPAVPKISRTGPFRDPGPGEDRYTTYLAFTTAGNTRADWLTTGEAASAVLLTATTVGLASSVVSDTPNTCDTPAGCWQLTIRLGVNESAPAVPPRPRRPHDEVIDVIRAA
ncbi:nitroreductase [Dactylosporangium sp. NPDC049525]|uniref:nitroreductase n=1 Tax=Dactylosporangium sp. NPDC049525 TaxID=3154730 RepID=UPI00343D7D83